MYENERITSENVENGENETDISSHVNANVNFTATSVQIPWTNKTQNLKRRTMIYSFLFNKAVFILR